MDGAKIQSYAVRIEHHLRAEYNCDRLGIGGIADSDHIRSSGFYHCMAMVLVKYYSGDNVKLIDTFLSENWDIDGKRMDDIGIARVEEVLKQYDKVYETGKKTGRI